MPVVFDEIEATVRPEPPVATTAEEPAQPEQRPAADVRNELERLEILSRRRRAD
jgi:hypothetical protein